ncbi:MAG: peroxiredoxin [Candidatus Cyclobacteriaceae bacterium M3_2C_046]
MNSKLIIFSLFFAALHLMSFTNAPVEPGDNAPGFSALDDQGNQWELEDHIGKKFIVMYFYPAAMTGGCTKQACSYRDQKEDLEQLDATVIGISGDEVKNLDYFKQAHDLNFTLLSDPEGKIAQKYGVPVRDGGEITRTIGGKDIVLNRGITTSRWTFVIDKNGKIIYKNNDVNPEQDSQQVMAAIKEAKS